MKHELKTTVEDYTRIENGTKTFEIRGSHDGYQMGDFVVLKEFDTSPIEDGQQRQGIEAMLMGAPAKGFTGREIKFRVGYVIPIGKGRVVFSLIPLPVSLL